MGGRLVPPNFTHDLDFVESFPSVSQVRGTPCGSEQSDDHKTEHIEVRGKIIRDLPSAAVEPQFLRYHRVRQNPRTRAAISSRSTTPH